MLHIKTPIRSNLVDYVFRVPPASVLRNIGNQIANDDTGKSRVWPTYDYLASVSGGLRNLLSSVGLIGVDVANGASESNYSFAKPNVHVPSMSELIARENQALLGLKLLVQESSLDPRLRIPAKETEVDHATFVGSVTEGDRKDRFTIQTWGKTPLNNYDYVPYYYGSLKAGKTASLTYDNAFKRWTMASVTLDPSAVAITDLNSYFEEAIRQVESSSGYERTYAYSGYSSIKKYVTDISYGELDNMIWVKYIHRTVIRSTFGTVYDNTFEISRFISWAIDGSSTTPSVSYNVPFRKIVVTQIYTVNHVSASINGSAQTPQGLFTKTTTASYYPSPLAILGSQLHPSRNSSTVHDKIMTTPIYMPEHTRMVRYENIVDAGTGFYNYNQAELRRLVVVASAKATNNAIDAIDTDYTETAVEYEQAITLLSSQPQVVAQFRENQRLSGLKADIGRVVGVKDVDAWLDYAAKFEPQRFAAAWNVAARDRLVRSMQKYASYNRGTALMKSLSGTYLATIFGFAPLIQAGLDIPSLAGLLKSIGRIEGHGVTRGSVTKTFPDIYQASGFSKITAVARTTLHWKTDAATMASGALALARANLLNPLSTIFNLVPYEWLFSTLDNTAQTAIRLSENIFRDIAVGSLYQVHTIRVQFDLTDDALSTYGLVRRNRAEPVSFVLFRRRLTLGAPSWDGVVPDTDGDISAGKLFTIANFIFIKSS